MNKTLPIFIIAATILGILAACKSDNPQFNYTEEEYVVSGYTGIVGFNINPDDSVLRDLDSVYFAIDLNTARIFNADSLPYGTDVSKLTVNIITNPSASSDDETSTATNNVSGIEITYKTATGDSTVNYTDTEKEHPDSIDFSRGPVYVKVTAVNGTSKRIYEVNVNVHKMLPDSLMWRQTAQADMPTSLSVPVAAAALEYQGKAMVFTAAGNDLSVATSDNPGSGDWKTTKTTLGFTPDPDNMTAADKALYMLDKSGELYSSADGLTWTSTGSTGWVSVIGTYADEVIGVARNQAGKMVHSRYPNAYASEMVVDNDFPVTETGQALTYTTRWQIEPQLIMAGGVTASGTTVGDTWGYDGSRWLKLSLVPMPARSGMAMFPYSFFRTSMSGWAVYEFSIWVALGGRTADGKTDNTVYYSYDAGLHWSKAPQLMQMPEFVPATYGSQTLIFKSMLTESRSARATGWAELPQVKLPGWYEVVTPRMTASRAVTPITEWECPYIYLIGGYTADGKLNREMWQGVINRLSFKPIQ